jgi:hypothetical protein
LDAWRIKQWIMAKIRAAIRVEVIMDSYNITQDEKNRSWCVHYDSAEGAVEIKCFRHRDAAIGYGRWLASNSSSGRLTIRELDGSTKTMKLERHNFNTHR